MTCFFFQSRNVNRVYSNDILFSLFFRGISVRSHILFDQLRDQFGQAHASGLRICPEHSFLSFRKIQVQILPFFFHIFHGRVFGCLIARAVNDEEVFEEWLISGVADGDIEEETTDEELDYYVKDDAVFAEFMDVFLHVMKRAYKSGGLYVDRVVSRMMPDEEESG